MSSVHSKKKKNPILILLKKHLIFVDQIHWYSTLGAVSPSFECLKRENRFGKPTCLFDTSLACHSLENKTRLAFQY